MSVKYQKRKEETPNVVLNRPVKKDNKTCPGFPLAAGASFRVSIHSDFGQTQPANFFFNYYFIFYFFCKPRVQLIWVKVNLSPWPLSSSWSTATCVVDPFPDGTGRRDWAQHSGQKVSLCIWGLKALNFHCNQTTHLSCWATHSCASTHFQQDASCKWGDGASQPHKARPIFLERKH